MQNRGTVLTGAAIERATLLSIRSAVKLEIQIPGMCLSRGRTAVRIARARFKLPKSMKPKEVLQHIENVLKKFEAENHDAIVAGTKVI